MVCIIYFLIFNYQNILYCLLITQHYKTHLSLMDATNETGSANHQKNMIEQSVFEVIISLNRKNTQENINILD